MGSRLRGKRGPLDGLSGGDGIRPQHQAHSTEADSISREPTVP